ncbi:MAG: hypothetical protein AB1781_05025 [Pseudomonadota bacterium]
MAQKILATGGADIAGAALVPKLLEEGARLRGLAPSAFAVPVIGSFNLLKNRFAWNRILSGAGIATVCFHLLKKGSHKIFHKNILLRLLIFLLFFDVNNAAYAYLDPGTGSIILQLLFGGVAGALVIAKLYWHRIKSFFGRKGNSKGSEGGRWGRR